jgi:hypothetical protein
MTTPTTPEQAIALSRYLTHSSLDRFTPHPMDALRSLAKQVEALTAERDALRTILVDSVAALGTAATVSQTSSIEFLKDVPGEIRKTVGALKVDAERFYHIGSQAMPVQQDSTKEPGSFWWRCLVRRLPSAPTFTEAVDAAMKAAS